MLFDDVVHCIENELGIILKASLEDIHFPVDRDLNVSTIITLLVSLTSSHQDTTLVNLDLVLFPIRHVVNVELESSLRLQITIRYFALGMSLEKSEGTFELYLLIAVVDADFQ